MKNGVDKSNQFLVLLPLVLVLTSCSGYSNSHFIGSQGKAEQASSLVAAQPLNYEDYADVLKKYVDSSGRVDYEKLKGDRQKLDQFNAGIASVSPALYESWTKEEKIAFLVNAYNSLTLESIINHYPVKSIKDIFGVWDRQQFKVIGQEMTLNNIEHETLRKNFNEPRIHMALVCASIGCPNLRTEPYTSQKLNAQLDRQSRIFLANPRNFRIERDSNKVYVSSIFKWFGEDFEKNYGKTQNLAGLNNKETAFLNFISQYVSPADREYLHQGGYHVDYLNYDWSLNVKQ